MKMRRYSGLFLSIIVGFYFLAPAQESGKKIHNALAEISACKDRTQLELSSDWENTLGIGKAGIFSEPRDIEIGKNGDIYVVDSEKKQISIFDSTGKRLRTIGKEGSKPGEFLFPVSLALDSRGNMIVGDEGWRGVRILDSTGKPIGGFKLFDSTFYSLALTRTEEIVLPNAVLTFKPSPLLSIYDYKGTVLGRRGKRAGNGSERVFFMRNLVRCSTDAQDNLFVAYLARPLILKFSSGGKQLLEITYELPFGIPEATIDQDHFIDSEGPFVKSILSDSGGNIYLVTQTRLKSGKEKTIGRTLVLTYEDKSMKISTMKSDMKPEVTDLYQLLVFDSSGKIVASKQLDVFCDKIKVIGKSLFLIDTYVAHKIYKYIISFG
jgi:hypothetical protein